MSQVSSGGGIPVSLASLVCVWVACIVHSNMLWVLGAGAFQAHTYCGLEGPHCWRESAMYKFCGQPLHILSPLCLMYWNLRQSKAPLPPPPPPWCIRSLGVGYILWPVSTWSPPLAGAVHSAHCRSQSGISAKWRIKSGSSIYIVNYNTQNKDFFNLQAPPPQILCS